MKHEIKCPGYKGKPIENLSKEELIEAINYIYKMYLQAQKTASDYITFMGL